MASYTLQLVRNAEIREEEQDVLLTAPIGTLRLARPGRAIRTALELLASGGMDRDAISEAALLAETSSAAAQLSLSLALARVERNGFVRYTVADSHGPVATLEPLTADCVPGQPRLDGRFRLSRFACLRRVDDDLIVESPLGRARVVMHHGRGAAALAQFVAPRTISDLSALWALSATSALSD